MLAGSEEKPTFYVEIYSFSHFWVKSESVPSSFGLAFIFSSVFCQNRRDGMIVSRFVKFYAVFVPQVLPSSRHINVTAKGDWISSVQHIVTGVLHQCDSGFCIWGVIIVPLLLVWQHVNISHCTGQSKEKLSNLKRDKGKTVIFSKMFVLA